MGRGDSSFKIKSINQERRGGGSTPCLQILLTTGARGDCGLERGHVPFANACHGVFYCGDSSTNGPIHFVSFLIPIPLLTAKCPFGPTTPINKV